MRYLVFVTANAQRDIQKSIDWENERSKGLGARLLRCIGQKLKSISISPFSGTVRYDNVRCITVSKFHYLIHYMVNSKQQVIILRVLATKRKPTWE